MISTLGAVIADGVQLPGSGDEALKAERLPNVVTAYAALCQDAFHRSERWALDGAPSAAHWLAQRTNAPRRARKDRIRDGIALRTLPTTVQAASHGILPAANLRALPGCVARYPTFAQRDEDILVPNASALAAERTGRPRGRGSAGPTRSPPTTGTPTGAQSRRQSRCPNCSSPRPFLTETVDGAVHLDGTLHGDDGAIAIAAVNAILDPILRAARDLREPSASGLPTPALRAQAFVDLCARSLRREPSEAPDRYRVGIVIPNDATTHPDSPMTTCDAALYRIVLDENSEILDIGRTTQRWPTGIRRAISFRDRGSVFPGCDRGPAWTDIHHCHHWEHGGRTSVDNGALLCRRHHTLHPQAPMEGHHRQRSTMRQAPRRHPLHHRTVAHRCPDLRWPRATPRRPARRLPTARRGARPGVARRRPVRSRRDRPRRVARSSIWS